MYPDGHAWCYRCGYRRATSQTLGEMARRAQLRLSPTPQKDEEKMIALPFDAEFKVKNEEAQNWMAKYNLDSGVQVDYEIMWSDVCQYVVFPLYTMDGHLCAWQGRNFSGKGPKWVTFGEIHKHPQLLSSYKPGRPDALVLVEDIVSAIRVAETCDSMPLFGTHLSAERAAWIAQRFSKVIVWMDHDAFDKAQQIAAKFAIYPEVETYIVVTETDPKGHSNAEIAELLPVSGRKAGAAVPVPEANGSLDSEDRIPY